MSKKWMPFYVGDFLADTMHLGATETGIYLRLIMHCWQHGTIPIDDKALSRIAHCDGRTWRQHKPVILQFFDTANDVSMQHRRVTAELHRADEISNKRKEAALQKHNPEPAIAEHLDAQSQLQLQKKDKIPPNGGSSRYAFEAGVIKLNARDYDRWKTTFHNIELDAELMAMAPWAGEQKNWFHAVTAALKNKNQQSKERKEALERQGGFKWNSGIEGVI